MKVKEIQCKSCMTKSALTDYVINPYVGCQHGCKYCYAVFMKRFQNIREPWGDFVYAKVNCPELLRNELERNRAGNIWLSSVTDPYQPIEGKYKLTRKILDTIAGSPYGKKFTIEVLTKSALIRRDFDVIKKMNAEVGVSVNTLDNKVAGALEPFASLPTERIKTLKKAKEAGIKVFGFISPVIPGITKLDELFRELSFCGYAWVELLNTKPAYMARLMPVIRKNFPDAVHKIRFAIEHEEEYFQQTSKEIRTLEKKHGLKVKEIVRHNK